MLYTQKQKLQQHYGTNFIKHLTSITSCYPNSNSRNTGSNIIPILHMRKLRLEVVD